jgi:HPt (histidine-containing phosphotransfer) domain-containing protein
MSAPTIDLATFTELQDTAGAEFVAELVDTFLEETPGLLAELRRSLAAADAPAFERAAHSLKSNANTFGALTLGALARGLELGSLAAAGDGTALEALNEEYGRAAAALRELRHG